ncbi:MAG: PilW family protein [Gallionella sp.]|nr:PilW family protein [Gallionella sp.]
MLTPSSRMQVFVQAQRGLSLIEMMISITIGLIILSAMATLFSNQSKVRSELDKSNRMIDNGRYALELLSDNLSMAGFYGSYVPTTGVPAATPDPCDLAVLTNAATNLDVLRHHVQGFNAATAIVGATGVSAACGVYAAVAANNITPKTGSDVLAMRRASTSTPVAAASAAAAPNSANTIYLQVSNCTTATTPYQIAAGAPATSLLDKDCTTAASLRPFITQIYLVTSDNNAGDGIPTLKRVELDQATGALVTTPLVEGIEYMQVEYGVDGDSNGDGIVDMAVFDGAPDSYVQTCPNATCWSRVVSVKIHIIARNIDPTPGYTDTKTYVLGAAGNFGPFNAAPYNAAPNPTTYPTLANYKRHAYTKVIRLVNPSGRLAP